MINIERKLQEEYGRLDRINSLLEESNRVVGLFKNLEVSIQNYLSCIVVSYKYITVAFIYFENSWYISHATGWILTEDPVGSFIRIVASRTN